MNLLRQIAPVLLVGMSLVAWDYFSTLERSDRLLRERLLSDEFAVVRDKLERLFTLAYQTNRTLSLLPSIRSLKGGNRTNEDDDPVLQGRFTTEGAQTVQQLYNNLAVNVAVSEIYCVIKGFQPNQGEVPFFMYDQLIVEEGPAQNTAQAANPDAPEDYEADEYQFFQGQLTDLEAHEPRFRFTALDQIPAQASPLMRTCDNSQYRSKQSGDVRNAEGFIYSVPFYSGEGSFRGVIASIFRTNTLEAQLLQVPFLPITPDDQAQMKLQGWHLPDSPGNFVLYVKERNFWVGDRREPGFLKTVQDALQTQQLPADWHQEPLKVVDSHPWMLLYRYNPSAVSDMQQSVLLRAGLELSVLGMLLLGMVFYQRAEHTRMKTLEDLIDSISILKAGDLSRHKAPASAGSAGMRLELRLEQVFSELVTDLRAKIQLLDRRSGQTRDISSQLTDTALALDGDAKNVLTLSQGAAAQASGAAQHSQSISAAIHNLALELSTITSGATELTVVAKEISSQCQRVRLESSSGEAQASRARADMIELEESVRRSREAVVAIQSLAHQTNMVALNATIEAASAGQAGLGFAVVAREVKNLSRETQEAAERIDALMTNIRERAGHTRQAVEEVTTALQSNLSFVQHVASAAEEQSATVSEVSRSLESLRQTGDGVAAAARSASTELETALTGVKRLSDASQSLSTKQRSLDQGAKALDSVVHDLTSIIRHFKIQ